MAVVDGGRELGSVVELALACQDRRLLHEQLLDVLDRAVGFDKGSLSICEGVGSQTCARGYDRIAAFEHLDHYMNELEPHEISAALDGKPIVDIDALSAQRRDRLSLYHEFLRPESPAGSSVPSAWSTRGAFTFRPPETTSPRMAGRSIWGRATRGSCSGGATTIVVWAM